MNADAATRVRDDQPNASNQQLSKGNRVRRLFATFMLLPAWFAPHKSIRVGCHRLRGVRIGRNVEIGYFCVIDNVHPEHVVIEDDVVIAAKATILSHDNSKYYAQGGDVTFAEVRVKRKAFIGINAVILPGVIVGERAIVGANSVVTRDVADNSIVAGIPARPTRSKEE